MTFKQHLLEETLKNIAINPIPGLSLKAQQQYVSLASYLLQPTIKPKDLGLTYATIKYWEAKGYLILPLIKEADEWRKYTVVESLWFELLKQVVDMGCSLEKVAPHLIFTYATFKSPNSAVKFNDPAAPLAIINEVKITPFDNFLKHILLIILGRARATININKQGVKLLFSNEGSIKAAANAEYETLYTSGINICISDMLFSLVLGEEDTLKTKLQIFNEAEMKVFRLLKTDNVSEVVVKQNKGKIYQVEYVEKMEPEGTAQPLNRFINEKNQELTIKTNNNKNSISVKRTTKERF